jgi:preprotein translocase subunit SecF
MLSGTYSSIFIATPVLADLKEREPQYKQLAKQVALRAAGGRGALRKAQSATTGATAVAVGGSGSSSGNGGPPGNGAPGNRSATAVGVSGASAADTDDDLSPGDDFEDESLAASQPAGTSPRAASPRPAGARQQPVRRPAAKRRPSGKKKRR